jgi:hypothetical protein
MGVTRNTNIYSKKKKVPRKIIVQQKRMKMKKAVQTGTQVWTAHLKADLTFFRPAFLQAGGLKAEQPIKGLIKEGSP